MISNVKQMCFSDDNVLYIKVYIFKLCTLEFWLEISPLMYASLAADGWEKIITNWYALMTWKLSELDEPKGTAKR